jgi:hypothetical protein
MKKLIILLTTSFISTTTFCQLGLYHPLYSTGTMPSSIEILDSNAIYSSFSKDLNSANIYGELHYFRKSKSGKMIYGIGGSSSYDKNSYWTNNFQNEIKISANRTLWKNDIRSLKLGGSLSTRPQLDILSYKYYFGLNTALGISYEGKWLEATVTHYLDGARYSFNSEKTYFYAYNQISGFIGVKSQLKWAEMRTRLTLASFLSTPILSQQFRLKKEFTFGYGIGFGYYQGDIGYHFNKVTVNLSYSYNESIPYKSMGSSSFQDISLGLKYNF